MKEDLNLLKNIIDSGKKWSEVSRSLPGRTEHAVKNRYNSLLNQFNKINKISKEKEEEEKIKKIYEELTKKKKNCKNDDSPKRKILFLQALKKIKKLKKSRLSCKLVDIKKKKKSLNILQMLLKKPEQIVKTEPKIEKSKTINFNVKIEPQNHTSLTPPTFYNQMPLINPNQNFPFFQYPNNQQRSNPQFQQMFCQLNGSNWIFFKKNY